jgi:hypothetical protein
LNGVKGLRHAKVSILTYIDLKSIIALNAESS